MCAQKKYPKNILLAVDGSEHAYAASKFVVSLPLSTSCHIHAISVLIPRLAQYLSTLTPVLQQAEKTLQQSQASFHSQLITGEPAEILNAYADEHRPDLTVMGAKGLRSTFGILLGGVAQKVLDYSCCPVLIVRAPFRPLKNILFVLDGSKNSQGALQYLAEFAFPKNTRVHVMHVLPPVFPADFRFYAWSDVLDYAPLTITTEFDEQMQAQAEAEQQKGEELVNQTVQYLQEHGIEADGHIERGDAATQIIAYAENEALDLIVAGSRGLGQIQSWLLGSVSRKLANYAKCSVLIVKAPPDEPLPPPETDQKEAVPDAR